MRAEPPRHVSEAERLRKLAEWFRGFAQVGNTADRQSRIEWAAELDRMADEERRAAEAS